MPNEWIIALKKWNTGKETWCLPKKGSKAYDEVRALMPPSAKKLKASAQPEKAPEPESKPMPGSKRPPIIAPKKKPVIGDNAPPAPPMKIPMEPQRKAFSDSMAPKVKFVEPAKKAGSKRPPIIAPKKPVIGNIDDELDAGVADMPKVQSQSRRLDQEIYKDIVRMAGEMERAEIKNHTIVRKEMELKSSALAFVNRTRPADKKAWKEATDFLSKNERDRVRIGGNRGPVDSDIVDLYLKVKNGQITSDNLISYAFLKMLINQYAIGINGRPAGPEMERSSDLYRISWYAISYDDSDLPDDYILYKTLDGMSDSFYDALREIWNPELVITPKAKAQEVEDWLNDEENEEFEDYYGTFFEKEGLTAELVFTRTKVGEDEKARKELLEQFNSLVKQKGARVSGDWSKKSDEVLKKAIEKMKGYKDAVPKPAKKK